MSWTKQQVLILIHLYKERRCLYDLTTNNFYQNRTARQKALREVELKLKEIRPSTTVVELKQKFCTLRTYFYKEIKKVEEYKRNGKVYNSSLWYFSELQFLLDSNGNRKSWASDISINDNPLETEIIHVDSPEPIDNTPNFNLIFDFQTNQIKPAKFDKNEVDHTINSDCTMKDINTDNSIHGLTKVTKESNEEKLVSPPSVKPIAAQNQNKRKIQIILVAANKMPGEKINSETSSPMINRIDQNLVRFNNGTNMKYSPLPETKEICKKQITINPKFIKADNGIKMKTEKKCNVKAVNEITSKSGDDIFGDFVAMKLKAIGDVAYKNDVINAIISILKNNNEPRDYRAVDYSYFVADKLKQIVDMKKRQEVEFQISKIISNAFK